MKKYQSLYYLLFVLLVMGAFASMAQNNYGMRLLGIVSLVFGVLFAIQFFIIWKKKSKKNIFSLVELASMSLIALLFTMRVFYIRFPLVEWLFVAAVMVLFFVYLQKNAETICKHDRCK